MSLEAEVRRAAGTDQLLAGVNQLDQQVASINGRLANLEQRGATSGTSGVDGGQGQPGTSGTSGRDAAASGAPSIEVGAMGYREATSWAQVQNYVASNQAVVINRPIDVHSSAKLETDAPLLFTPQGKLKLGSRFTQATLNLPLLNPGNRAIFEGLSIREEYPARWDASKRTNLNGNFGGEAVRDARWFGASPMLGASSASAAHRERNNVAIAAAALSQDIIQRQVLVYLGAGDYPIGRTVRLDGLRAKLIAAPGSMAATRLWAHSHSLDFDESHFITTTDFPQTDQDPDQWGTTPIVEIGAEYQSRENMDEGFHSGVRNITIVGPDRFRRPISGIMWESALLERGEVSDVCVQIYSGYAIGGPRWQHLQHNQQHGLYFPQVNSCKFENLWIFTPTYKRAVGLNIFGMNWRLTNATVDHGRGTGGMETHANQMGARYCGVVQNVHIEASPKQGLKHAGICCPAKGASAERMQFDGIHYLGSAPWATAERRTLLLENNRGGYTCSNITMAAPYNSGARAIEDTLTGRTSQGYHHTQPTVGTHVDFYGRSMNKGKARVNTDDEGLA